MKQAVIVTTTFYNNTEDGDLRKGLSRKFVRRAAELGYPVVVVDGGTDNGKYLDELKSQGALAFPETQRGLGPSRREAIRHAYEFAKQHNIPNIVWSEPEKVDLINHLDNLLDYAEKSQFDAIVPSRITLEGYPIAQQLSEALGNQLQKDYGYVDCNGNTLDSFFGPKLWATRNTPYFLAFGSRKVSAELAAMRIEKLSLQYKMPLSEEVRQLEICKSGTDLIRTDHAMHMPICLMILEGRRVLPFPVNYKHPQEQTQSEEKHSAEYNLKRILQLTAILEQAELVRRLYKSKILEEEILRAGLL